jgi:hypothetical protein
VRLYVPLSRREVDQLIKLAAVERRRPQDQAAVLLAATLARVETDGRPEPQGDRTSETDHHEGVTQRGTP